MSCTAPGSAAEAHGRTVVRISEDLHVHVVLTVLAGVVGAVRGGGATQPAAVIRMDIQARDLGLRRQNSGQLQLCVPQVSMNGPSCRPNKRPKSPAAKDTKPTTK